MGAELASRLDDTERLLKAQKFAHAQALAAAQQEAEEPPPMQALVAIQKLELQAANMRSFIRVRTLTREPGLLSE
jgi:hypothetical protein